MAISETKMQMVIANYFKDECDVNTSIRQAFEKGFRIGVKKGASMNRPQGEWKSVKASIYPYGYDVECSVCGHRMGSSFGYKYCPMCGAHMKGAGDE